MSAIRYPGYRCLMMGCGARLTTAYGLSRHSRAYHPGGIYWKKGDLSVSVGNDDDGKYLAACDRHSFCCNMTSLAEAKRFVVEDFCEVCSGSCRWCRSCDMAETIHCEPEGHDVIDDSVSARNYRQALLDFESRFA